MTMQSASGGSATIEDPLPAPRRASGRPTREAAIERDARLLAAATAMFEARGYDATTMEAVAEAAGVGKPTIYARFRDKADLFRAVFHARVAAFLSPVADAVRTVIETEAGANSDMDTVLFKIGMAVLPRAVKPEFRAINRIVVAEAVRFSELAQMAHREGWQATVSLIAAALEVFHAARRIEVDDPVEAADLFLSLLLGRLQRATELGVLTMDAEAIRNRVDASVRIFLRGVAVPPP